MAYGLARTFTRADDERDLTILYLKDVQGMTLSAIAQRFHISRSAVARVIKRVRDTYAAPCTCRKAENRDGGMAERWWRNGA